MLKEPTYCLFTVQTLVLWSQAKPRPPRNENALMCLQGTQLITGHHVPRPLSEWAEVTLERQACWDPNSTTTPGCGLGITLEEERSPLKQLSQISGLCSLEKDLSKNNRTTVFKRDPPHQITLTALDSFSPSTSSLPKFCHCHWSRKNKIIPISTTILEYSCLPCASFACFIPLSSHPLCESGVITPFYRQASKSPHPESK